MNMSSFHPAKKTNLAELTMYDSLVNSDKGTTAEITLTYRPYASLKCSDNNKWSLILCGKSTSKHEPKTSQAGQILPGTPQRDHTSSQPLTLPSSRLTRRL